MRIALLIVATLFPAVAAQTPVPRWVAVGSGPGSDVAEAIAMAPTPSSDLVAVAGTFERTLSFGAMTVESADLPDGRSDAFLAVFSKSTGAPLWARRMGTGVFNDFGTGAAVCPDGTALVSGHFTGVATFDGGGAPDAELTTRNDFDGFLAAYTSAGDLLWVEQIGGAEQDLARRVVCDAEGGIAVVGSFAGTATWGAGAAAQTRTAAGSADGFVAAYGSDGTLRWVTTVGGSDFDALTDAAVPLQYDTGLLVVSGTFRGAAAFGDVSLQSRGQSDAVTLRLDPADGAVLAAGQVGGSGFDYGRGIAVNSFPEGVMLAGSFENDIVLGQTVLQSAGQSDAFFAILNTDTLGPVEGDRVGGEGVDYATDATSLLALYGDLGGETYGVVGVLGGDASSTFEGFGTGTAVDFEGRGFDDGFAISYFAPAPSYAYVAEVLGGANADRAYAVAGDGDYGGAVAGTFRDVAQIGTSSVQGSEGNEVFAAYFDPGEFSPVFVADEAGPGDAGVELVVGPNPSRGRAAVTLRLAAPAAVTVDVVDALGRTVAELASGALPAGEARWALPALGPGVYVVRVRGEATARRAFTVVR